ncbi:hypothetical protein J2Y69_000193 [Microbacterium resistens]|uniref:Uncharacterized protein n=1 Tax=Microbacterium resistens TaxID=156977 RepID=A0ABU1S7P3_9MICO|nr:hypothetical protein [Microbacterium resistens]
MSEPIPIATMAAGVPVTPRAHNSMHTDRCTTSSRVHNHLRDPVVHP